MSDEAVYEPTLKDKLIPWYFVMFFTVLAIVNGFFVYTAITTHTGVVTEKPYEKGLAFDEKLEAARNQPAIEEYFSFKDGAVSWHLKGVEGASARATFFRPVQGGHDFGVDLEAAADHYSATPDFPLKGLWHVRLHAQWNEQSYHKTYPVVVR